MHALSLRLLTELWRHHREPSASEGGAGAGLIVAEPDVIGAARRVRLPRLTPTAPPHSPDLRACLEPKAPFAARALALGLWPRCDADALDFYAAFKVVTKRMSSLPRSHSWRRGGRVIRRRMAGRPRPDRKRRQLSRRRRGASRAGLFDGGSGGGAINRR